MRMWDAVQLAMIRAVEGAGQRNPGDAAAAPTTTPIIQPTGTAPGGMNFNDISPTDGGIKPVTIWRPIAQIVMYVGYGFTFLAFLAGIAVWGFGSAFLGRDTVEHAKKNILRAGGAAIILGSAGAIWTWLITR